MLHGEKIGRRVFLAGYKNEKNCGSLHVIVLGSKGDPVKLEDEQVVVADSILAGKRNRMYGMSK
jgi:hypothetical protein